MRYLRFMWIQVVALALIIRGSGLAHEGTSARPQCLGSINLPVCGDGEVEPSLVTNPRVINRNIVQRLESEEEGIWNSNRKWNYARESSLAEREKERRGNFFCSCDRNDLGYTLKRVWPVRIEKCEKEGELILVGIRC